MYLRKLQLLNFKNYEELNLEFTANINVLVGRNGSGKTNLLDAIYYLSFTKSAFSGTDLQSIRKGQPYFMVKGQFTRASSATELSSSVQNGAKKVFREDAVDYLKLSDHIGKYPVILIAPDDVDIVKEGSEARRRFFDTLISQLDKRYLEDLIAYNQVIRQRNSLLKMFQETGKTDWLAVESYDQLLVRLGNAIFERRRDFAAEFLPVFRQYFRYIVSEGETSDLEYQSELTHTDVASGLMKSRQKDLALQRTSFGIHRDDYYFTLGDGDLKRLGSQGQQKSFVIALKLAQFEILEKYKGFKPILLLDDIFDKLDDHRIAKLLELIKNHLGQLFITDARPDRTSDLLESVDVPAAIFRVENGTITVLR